MKMNAEIFRVRARPRFHDELDLLGLKDSLHVVGEFGYKHPKSFSNKIQPFGSVRHSFEVFEAEFENFIKRDVPHRKSTASKRKRGDEKVLKTMRELKRQFLRVEVNWKRKGDFQSHIPNFLVDSHSESDSDSL